MSFAGFNKSRISSGFVKNRRGRNRIAMVTEKNPSLQNQVKNVKKSVKKIQNKEELKYKDVFLNGPAISNVAAGTITGLTGLIMGTTQGTRMGEEVRPTSIQFKAFAQQDATNIDTAVLWRHIIFWDGQNNSSFLGNAAPQSLLDTSVITLAVLAPYDKEQQKRFKVVYDKLFITNPQVQDPANQATQICSPIHFTKKKRQLNRTVKYIANNGTNADITTNALYSVWYTSILNGGNVYCGYRLYYKDD